MLVPLAAVCQSPGVTVDSPTVQNSGAAPSQAQPTSAEAKVKPGVAVHRMLPKQERNADDAYLEGARCFARRDFDKAQHHFEQAVRLDPGNRTYILALLYSREVNVNRLIRAALRARLRGDFANADVLLMSARRLDPKNPLVTQYNAGQEFQQSAPRTKERMEEEFEGPIAFAPFGGVKSFHIQGELGQVVHELYGGFGIAAVFDSSVASDTPFRIDMDDVDFIDSVRVLKKAAHLLAVPLDPTTALIAADTKELRESLTPLVEETIYLSGQTPQQMLDLANMTRALFGLTQIAVNTQSGAVVIRGPQAVVHRVHDLFTELASRTSDILFDINIYEVDKSTTRNIGFAPPTSATAIDVASTAQKLISDNQSLLSQSISSGALTLSGSTYDQELQEVAFLVAAGVSGSSSFTSILGTLGSFDGIPLLGISMSSTSLNMLLNSTDARMLNALQLRSSDRQEVTFRVGSRYPILTAITTSASSSDVANELAAAGVSSSVIAQLTGSSGSGSTSTPQIQFEDIGLTLKITPRVLRSGEVQLDLDFKLESLAGTGVDDIPILNNRALKSVVTIPPGETTMLAALVSTNETKALDGVPGLDNLPGFQSTDRNADGAKDELLITVTPHIVSGSTTRISVYGPVGKF
ncbi:type II and III secretion system protein [Terriglobus saanensis SP1PR4]|uniref:Type II and III secretion system protein n=2 Tax=Terriglobus saanensis TaxID=870903 RepID=E8V1W9_TERSS|nr:type II and III secretion system protein [Terriglobus saanensis SP1PR4]